jgi:hypothetical protein
MRRDGYGSFMSKRPAAEGNEETAGVTNAINVTLRAAQLRPSTVRYRL